MALHPDLEAFLELANTAGSSKARPMSDMSPREARLAYDRSTIVLDLPGPDIRVETLTIACRDGHQLGARLYRGTTADRAPVLLYFHGGGYVLGGLDSHDSLCRALAQLTPCVVMAIDYRLGPDHKFPVAFHDAVDAGAWLLQHGSSLGLDTARRAYGGDSVGGTLAAALTIAERDSGHQPRLQLLLYPCTSSWQDTDSHRSYGTGHLLEHATLQWMFGHYLRNDDDRHDWRFAPLNAKDLAGLAPAHIALAEYDPLVDEGRAYAERLKAADVPTELVVYQGMIHDFARLGSIVEEAGTLRQDLARALHQAFS